MVVCWLPGLTHGATYQHHALVVPISCLLTVRDARRHHASGPWLVGVHSPDAYHSVFIQAREERAACNAYVVIYQNNCMNIANAAIQLWGARIASCAGYGRASSTPGWASASWLAFSSPVPCGVV
jgi:hypothetical protein